MLFVGQEDGLGPTGGRIPPHPTVVPDALLPPFPLVAAVVAADSNAFVVRYRLAGSNIMLTESWYPDADAVEFSLDSRMMGGTAGSAQHC